MSSVEEIKDVPCRQRGRSRRRRGGKKRAQRSEPALGRLDTLPTESGEQGHGLGAGRGLSLSLPPADSKRNKDRDTVSGILLCNAVLGGCRQSEERCEYKPKSCHSFMTKSSTGARSRIHSAMIQRHQHAPPKTLSKWQKARWLKRDERVAALKEFPASPKHAFKVDNNRTYFLGSKNFADHWPDDAKHVLVSWLRIIDTIRGARIDGICTLLPHKNLSSFKSPAVFQHLQDLERSTPSSKTENARGKFAAPKTATGPIGRCTTRRSGLGRGARSGNASSCRISR